MASIVLAGATSGSTTIQPTDAVTVTVTLPASGGTLQTSGAGFTTNGVAYATSTSALATGSGLIFDGTNLGVGVTPSAWSGVKGFQVNTGCSINGSALNATFGSNCYYDGTNWRYIVSAYSNNYYSNYGNQGSHIWQIAPSGTAGAAITFTQAMTLDTSGNLLVGTTTSVAGCNINSNVSYDGNGGISVKNTSTGTSASAAIKFLNSGSTNAYIGLFGNSRTAYVNLVANALANYTDNTAGIAYLVDAAGPITYGTNSTLRMTISSTGNIGAPSGTNIYNASDARLKKNIMSLPSALNKVNALKPVSFNWIDDFCKEENNKLMYGFIAQEVKEVDETLIENFSNSTLKVGDVDIENPLRVNEKFIIPMLVKAIQELNTLVTTQSAEIAALKAKVGA
jgi:hypothetical protein